jgi:hypothetical protein
MRISEFVFGDSAANFDFLLGVKCGGTMVRQG